MNGCLPKTSMLTSRPALAGEDPSAMMQYPGTLPEPHRLFIERALPLLAADLRIVGVAAAGSYADDRMDEFSDLDLVVAAEAAQFVSVMDERESIAARIAPLLVAFTGEHVGEPRLLICLYGPPVLHVDLKFVPLEEAGKRVDDPVVLWEREGALTAVLARSEAHYPAPDLQWVEDRFWVWVHYAAMKIARGELLEAGDFLSWVRASVLAPLGLVQLGVRPSGVRRLEQVAPQLARELARTLAPLDARSLTAAVREAIAVYRRLRGGASAPVVARTAAEVAAVESLAGVERGLQRTA